MKLQTLISCDVYRDGGSLQATWLSDEGKEWNLTLRINSWKDPREVKSYRLYQCKLAETASHPRIEKNSPVHEQIVTIVEAWASANMSLLEELEKDRDSFNCIPLFLAKLRTGNY